MLFGTFRGAGTVTATVRRGELSPVAKTAVPWSTVANSGVRRGAPTFTAVNTAGNHGQLPKVYVIAEDYEKQPPRK